MCWSPDSQLLCSSGGKVIHLWTNQVALEETLRDLKKQLESATSEAHKVTRKKWQGCAGSGFCIRPIISMHQSKFKLLK